MSLFKKLFNQSGESPPKQTTATASNGQGQATAISRSNFPFGRYTDSNKTTEQRQHYKKAVDAFKANNYLDSFDHLMTYIQDTNVKNLSFERTDSELTFEMKQGSNLIRGKATNERFEAISRIAEMETPSVPVLRKLMTLNYRLNYSKFALDESTICMKFTSLPLDASPNKLYYGLQELARKADQQDDLLISEFSAVKEIESETTVTVDEAKQGVQIKYLKQWINETFEEINKYDPNAFSGGVAFLLLRLSYRIDYLIKPQGVLMDQLEKIQHIFFAKSNDTTVVRNSKIMDEFNKILTWDDEKLREGLYDTVSTFSLVNPTNHKTVMDMVFSEMDKSKWYIDNNYPTIAHSTFEYAVAYAFFNYGMYYPVMHIFDIVMNIYNPEYYREMGISTNYIDADGKLNANEITKQLNKVISASKQEFPKIDFRVHNVKFDSTINFFHTLMTEVDYMNFSQQ